MWWRSPALLRTCLVNFTHDPDTALRGVLWATRGRWLVFRNVDMLKPGVPPQAMDGEVVVERPRVAFLQVLP